MRLIATDSLEIQDFPYDRIPDYAILSHRWGDQEVTLQEMQQGSATTKAKQGFIKVQQCCAKARADGYDYVWADTCCIDKTSSAELSEAINSMYTWYYQASRCYAYLADVPSRCPLEESEWFARGWTLQELLAPEEVYFVDDQWADLGTKETLRQVVHERTGIPMDVLSGEVDVETASVAQRMSWAAKRQTTRPEDKAYSLLGIFGIQMPLLYGEGERAFTRLQHEIMKTSDDHSLFAWTSPDARGGLLATSPDAFAESGRVREQTISGLASSSLTTGSRGVELEARIIGQGSGGLCLAVLNCTLPQPRHQEQEDQEDAPVGIWVRDKTLTMELFERVATEKMTSVDLSKYHVAQCSIRRICIESGRIKPLRRPFRSQSQSQQANPQNQSQHATTQNQSQHTTTSSVAALDAQMGELGIYDDSVLGLAGPVALIRAAEDGDENRVWLLLSRADVGVNQTDESGASALAVAAQHGHLAVVRLLLARGAAANATDASGQTAMHRAAQGGQAAVVTLLANTGSVAIDTKDKSGCTPLLLAAQQRHQAAVKILLAHGSDRQARDGRGRTILTCAAVNGDEAMIRMLLEDTGSGGGAGVALIEVMDQYHRTPLRAAAENGHTGTVILLLQHGAQADASDDLGKTTLLWAAVDGRAALVQLLLDAGAHVDALDDSNHTALLYAAHEGHEDVVRVLLGGGADITARDKDGWTPLWNAASRLKEGTAKLLLEAGSDIHATAHGGMTALDWAQQNGFAAMAKLLMELGASKEAETNSVMHLVQWAANAGETSTFEKLIKLSPNEFAPGEYHTAIGWAADNGSAALVKKLLDEGADVNTADNNHTMLEDAARNGHEDVVRLLLDAGANINQSGENDDTWTSTTPLSYAANYGYERVVQLLLERGADPDGMWIKRGKNEDRADQTPVRVAMHHNRHGIMKMLLDAGASPNVVGSLRHATLWYAVDKGDVPAVKLLVAAGAKLEFKDFGGDTALHFAVDRRKYDIVQVLIDGGASVTAEAQYHRTPLWNAAQRGDAKMVRILLDAGADIEKGDDKNTPLALAYQGDHPEAAKLLLERGAKTDFLKGNISEPGRGRKSKELQALFEEKIAKTA